MCPHCQHPLTAHTDTPETLPYAVCARYVQLGAGKPYTLCGCHLAARSVADECVCEDA